MDSDVAYLSVGLVGTTLTDLDLAIDAFMNHPVWTRSTHVTIP